MRFIIALIFYSTQVICQNIICEYNKIDEFVANNHEADIDYLIIRNCTNLDFDISKLKVNKLSISGKCNTTNYNLKLPETISELSIQANLYSIPCCIENLPKLVEIDLSDNYLSNTHDINWLKLINLRKIDVSHNFIRNIDNFFTHPNIKTINASYCRIEKIEVSNINHSLIELDISSNYIKKFIGFKNLQNILELNMCNMKLPLLINFVNIQVEYIDLMNTQLNSKSLLKISKCKSLKTIILSYNNISILPNYLYRINVISYIYLSHNKNIRIGSAFFKNKKNKSIEIGIDSTLYNNYLIKYNVCYIPKNSDLILSTMCIKGKNIYYVER